MSYQLFDFTCAPPVDLAVLIYLALNLSNNRVKADCFFGSSNSAIAERKFFSLTIFISNVFVSPKILSSAIPDTSNKKFFLSNFKRLHNSAYLLIKDLNSPALHSIHKGILLLIRKNRSISCLSPLDNSI